MERVDGTAWRKSSYSGANGGQCIEAGTAPDTILVRDSKDADGTGPMLRLSPAAWRRFTDQVKRSLAPDPTGSARL